jgi:hypothetical protein
MISVGGPVSMIWVEPASDGDGAVNRRSGGSAAPASSGCGSAIGSSAEADCTFSSGPDGFDI